VRSTPGEAQHLDEPGAARGPGEPRPHPAPPGGLGSRLLRLGTVRAAAIAAAVATVAVVLSLLSVSGPGSSSPRSLGQASNFDLAVLGHPRQHLSLASLDGRPVILNFFASWCPPCQRETPLIARFYQARHGRPAVIGIDVNDSTAAGLSFIRRKGVRYPVVVDQAPMKTALAYGLPGLPATFFLNARHQIVKRVFGALTPAELAAGAALISPR
jgi:cytochrome c biogenesis protein CcmG/thiol:disulfide interchange protein DsbE